MTPAARILPPTLAQWLPFFEASGTAWGVDALLLAAICERESGGGRFLTPPDASGTGDKGNGLGLMQIDRRYHQSFAAEVLEDGRFAWQDPARNIDYAAKLLADNIDHFDGDEMKAVASYNASRAHVAEVCAELTAPADAEAVLRACDAITTGHDYVTAVFAHRARFTIHRRPELTP